MSEFLNKLQEIVAGDGEKALADFLGAIIAEIEDLRRRMDLADRALTNLADEADLRETS